MRSVSEPFQRRTVRLRCSAFAVMDAQIRHEQECSGTPQAPPVPKKVRLYTTRSSLARNPYYSDHCGYYLVYYIRLFVIRGLLIRISAPMSGKRFDLSTKSQDEIYIPVCEWKTRKRPSELPHPVIRVTRINKVDARQGGLESRIRPFQLFRAGQDVFPARIGTVPAGQAAFISKDQDGLSDVQGMEPCGRDSDHFVTIPEFFIGQTAIFRTEEQGDSVCVRNSGQLSGHGSRIGSDRALSACSGGGSDDIIERFQSFDESGVVFHSTNQRRCCMGGQFERAYFIPVCGVHDIQVADTHVHGGPGCGADVFGIMKLVEYDSDLIEIQ